MTIPSSKSNSLTWVLLSMCLILELELGSAQADTIASCVVDQNCPQSYYCTATRKCAPCIDCQIYMREPSKGPRNCGKKRVECGPCLQGFRSDELTDQKYSIHCKPVGRSQRIVATEQTQLVQTSSYVWIALGCGLFVIFVLVLSIYLWKIKKEVQLRVAPNIDETRQLVRRPSTSPPPYQFSSLISVQQSDSTFVNEVVGEKETYLSEHCSQDRRFPDPTEEPEAENEANRALTQNENEDVNGSAETIPSTWAPDYDVEDGPENRNMSPISLDPPNPFYWSPLTRSLPNLPTTFPMPYESSRPRWSSDPSILPTQGLPVTLTLLDDETPPPMDSTPCYAFLAIMGTHGQDLLNSAVGYNTSMDSGFGASEAGRRRTASSSSHDDNEDTVEVVLEVGARIVVRRTRKLIILDAHSSPSN